MPQQRSFWFTVVYFFVSLLNIVALFFDRPHHRMLTMPLIGMSLILFLTITTRLATGYQRLVLVGLVLSLAGDIQLLFSSISEFYFLSAMLATLTGYLFYIAAFCQDLSLRRLSWQAGTVAAFVMTGVLLIFYRKFYEAMDELLIPVLLYMLINSLMVVIAALRPKSPDPLSYYLALGGVSLFVVSDYAIGYIFFSSYNRGTLIVYMAAYLAAQYLVVRSAEVD
jgi:uncharacterized membrane protein YhhN